MPGDPRQYIYQDNRLWMYFNIVKFGINLLVAIGDHFTCATLLNSRSWLRSSSTHEPSDTPLGVASCFAALLGIPSGPTSIAPVLSRGRRPSRQDCVTGCYILQSNRAAFNQYNVVSRSEFMVIGRFSGNRLDHDKRRAIHPGMRLSYLRALPWSRCLPYWLTYHACAILSLLSCFCWCWKSNNGQQ